MQRLEVSGALRLIYKSLGVKGLRAEKLFLQQTKVIACNTCTACIEAGRGNSMSCDVKPESCEERLGRRRMPAGKGCYIKHDKKKNNNAH